MTAMKMNVANRDRFVMMANDPASTDADLREVLAKSTNAEAQETAKRRLDARAKYNDATK